MNISAFYLHSSFCNKKNKQKKTFRARPGGKDFFFHSQMVVVDDKIDLSYECPSYRKVTKER